MVAVGDHLVFKTCVVNSPLQSIHSPCLICRVAVQKTGRQVALFNRQRASFFHREGILLESRKGTLRGCGKTRPFCTLNSEQGTGQLEPWGQDQSSERRGSGFFHELLGKFGAWRWSRDTRNGGTEPLGGASASGPARPSGAAAGQVFQAEGHQRVEESNDEGDTADNPGNKVLSWLLRMQPGEKIWTVPWKGDTIFLVMILWFTAFWFVGSWGMPLAAHALSWSFEGSVRGMAFYVLLTDIAEMAVGLSVLYYCLARFLPLPEGWFRIKWRGGWLLEVLAASFTFPLVKMLTVMSSFLLPVPTTFPSPPQVEQCLKEPFSMLLFVLVLSICAPIWEEVLFRGFLLPSLTRYLPIGSSIAVSSIIFALVHFQPQRLPSLAFLGVVLGTVFVRSRNLLPSMVLHSLWNSYIIADYLLKARRL